MDQPKFGIPKEVMDGYRKENSSNNIVSAYKLYIKSIVTLLGGEMSRTDEMIDNLFKFEMKLAEVNH